MAAFWLHPRKKPVQSSRRGIYIPRPLTPPYVRFRIRRFMSCLQETDVVEQRNKSKPTKVFFRVGEVHRPAEADYDTETISNQLKEIVDNFPSLDQGERKLLIESLIGQVEIGQKKRVAAVLRPPFAFGFFSPELAPRGIEPLF